MTQLIPLRAASGVDSLHFGKAYKLEGCLHVLGEDLLMKMTVKDQFWGRIKVKGGRTDVI